MESKRAKNCAACTEVKQDAMKWNAYAAAIEAINSAQRAGLTGDAVREAGRDAIEQARGMLSERGAQERVEARAKIAKRQARRALNAKLASRGYTWLKNDEEMAEAFNADWMLVGPNGATTVKQALAEIEASK